MTAALPPGAGSITRCVCCQRRLRRRRTMDSEDTLQIGEHHPAADMALRWFRIWQATDPVGYMQTCEAIASTALSGNRLAQVCYGTLERLRKGGPVGDRYLLGGRWFLKEMN